MSLRGMMLGLTLVSGSLLTTGCGGPKSTLVLHDSSLPIVDVYDAKGVKLEGYEAYAKGFVANQIKRCDAILDRLDRMKAIED